MRNICLLGMLFIAQLCNACTGLGIVTQSGTISGQNLDYYYCLPQKFELMVPIQQFYNWYDNNYHHNNRFYALISENNVQMGVNEHGLAVFVENSPRPQDYQQHRKFQQPENGNAEGMIKYGILQNFNTVDEILPYLSKIFSVAHPDFYQIADAKKILTVEVANAENNNDPKRKFTYEIISKANDYCTHTNHYLNSDYASFNNLKDTDFIRGSKNRYVKITELIMHSSIKDIDVAADWLKNTISDVSKESDSNWCQNTSLFRSNLQGLRKVVVGDPKNNMIYGTVSSMIVNNNNDPKKSFLYVMMVNSITTNRQGQQLIKYNELRTTLDKLFTESNPKFVKRKLTRTQPINKVCK